jgi:hypothetical protein
MQANFGVLYEVKSNTLFEDHIPPFIRIPNSYYQVKEISLQALTDPEGSRRLRLPDFKTIGT